jgi:indolepyruvate ferredoxin oxidoreductase beta subunit
VKSDIVLAGVGGQGVLSMAAIIAAAAGECELTVKQGEVHGMSQRGGAVQASLRLADGPIDSDLIPRGTADMILSMEPLESLRYLDYLAPEGTLLTSLDPFDNISNYPDLEQIHAHLRSLPRAILIEADRLAREAGSARSSNVVLIGAASHLLPIAPRTLETYIRMAFQPKGEKVVEINVRAFEAGVEAGRCVTS